MAEIKGMQGRVIFKRGTGEVVLCPKCKRYPVVYNGNYFCDGFGYSGGHSADECTWALPHPVRSKRDRDVCDLIGIDYH